MSGGGSLIKLLAVLLVALAAAFAVVQFLIPDEATDVAVTSPPAAGNAGPTDDTASTSTPGDVDDGPGPAVVDSDASAPAPAPSGAAPGETEAAALPPGQIAYVSAVGAGAADGSSTGQAAPITELGMLIAAAEGGLEIRIVANEPIQLEQSIAISAGGTPGAPITIRGWPPSEQGVELRGNRVAPYQVDGEPGREVFRLQPGADHLRFSGLSFTNVGVAFRATGDIADLAITDVSATNVRRFFDTNASQQNRTASVSGLLIQDVTVDGFSKNVIRVRYSSRDITIQDVAGDSQRQDGDNFAVGIQLAGTANDIVLRRVRMSNSTDSTGEYWNGDGFSVERGVFNVSFIDTLASGNTDGGYDIKGTGIVMRSVRAVDNKRNYRLWGEVDIQGCEGLDPNRRGGTGTQAQVQVAFRAEVVMTDCTFSDGDGSTIVFDVDGPDAAIRLEDVSVVRNEGGQLSTVEPANTLDLGDLTERFVAGV